jgi:chemotaxis signal transduction protein
VLEPERPHSKKMKGLEETGEKSPPQDATSETRELFVLSAGGRLFAVRPEETDGVAEGLTPAPLPHAPAAVLGVVSVRGRMHTVLYPPALFTNEGDSQNQAPQDAGEDAHAPRFVVSLRGDEQLALAADGVEGVVTIEADSLSTPGASDSPLSATLERDGRLIQILDASRIFDAAMRGAERRRPRA